MSFYTGTQAEAYYLLNKPVAAVGPSTTALIATAPGTAPRCIIPALFFSYLGSSGKGLRITARGVYLSSAATPPTFTAALTLNPTPGSITSNLVVVQFATTVQPAASITAGWQLEADMNCNNVSSTATTFQAGSRFEQSCVAQSTATPVPATLATLPAIQHSNNSLATVNSEVQYELAITVLQSVATAGNTFTVQQFTVVGLN
jgi:hypothetical protein